MSKLISLDLSRIKWLHCTVCDQHLPPEDYNEDTCNTCHDECATFDECGCPRCYENQEGAADFMENE